MSFCDKVGLLFFIVSIIRVLRILYLIILITLRKKRTSFRLERDKFIFMITAIILSSFLMQRRYYIESTNFLYIWSVLFPVQSLICKIFDFIFSTVQVCYYHLIVILTEK